MYFIFLEDSLPHISEVVSNTINEIKDALLDSLDSMTEDELDQLLPVFRSHLPKTIVDLSFDTVQEKVPKQYVKNGIASSLASRIVYREGTKFISSYPKNKLAELALSYIEKEKEIATLREVLAKTDIPEAEKASILNLLEAGGARTLLRDL